LGGATPHQPGRLFYPFGGGLMKLLVNLLYVEIIKMFTRWRTWVGFLILAILIPLIIIAAHLSGMDQPLDNFGQGRFIRSGDLLNGWFFSYFILNTLWIHIPFLLTFAAGDLFAGEGAEGTWRLILVRPVSRTTLFWAKWLANAVYTFSLILFMGVVTLLVGLLIEGGGDLFVVHPDLGMRIIEGKFAFLFILRAYLIGAGTMLIISVLALFFSVFVSNAIGPIIGAMGVMIIFFLIELLDFTLFQAIRPILFTHYLDLWNTTFFTDVAPAYYFKAIGVQLVTLLILTFSAFFVFRQKEILS
jgi:ABC-2 type transport system permease protein